MGYKAKLVAPPQIEQAILLIRGQRVMLDRDLAAMTPPETPHKEIGFHVKESSVRYRVKVKRK